jgi:hypothetical protein
MPDIPSGADAPAVRCRWRATIPARSAGPRDQSAPAIRAQRFRAPARARPLRGVAALAQLLGGGVLRAPWPVPWADAPLRAGDLAGDAAVYTSRISVMVLSGPCSFGRGLHRLMQPCPSARPGVASEWAPAGEGDHPPRRNGGGRVPAAHRRQPFTYWKCARS